MAVLLVLLSTFVWTGFSSAQAVYVTDSFEITLRTGPGNEYRILAMLPSGTRLELLEETEEWSRVQSQGGQEGWVRKQHLSRELPRKEVVERLERENARLRETAEKATARARELGDENKELGTSLAGRERELSGIQQEYTSLRADADNVVELKARYEAATAQLKNVTAEKEAMAVETQELRSGVRMRWFLTGAGVVGGSWLIGFIMGHLQRRNRRSSLY
jgi:SH3 domain protein